MTKDEYRLRHAHALIKGAMSELLRINKLDTVSARVLRDLYPMEDALWQLTNGGRRENGI